MAGDGRLNGTQLRSVEALAAQIIESLGDLAQAGHDSCMVARMEKQTNSYRPAGRQACRTTVAGAGWLVLLSLGLTACGGGGSSNDDDAPPPEPPPPVMATSVSLLDALPADGMTLSDPGIPDATLSHFGYADFTIGITGACVDGTMLTRTLEDISVDFDALFEHNQVCSVAPTGAFETVIDATRTDGDAFTVSHGFSTTTETAPSLLVQDSVATPRDTVADLFQTFIDDSLMEGLDLPDAVGSLVEEAVTAIAESAYDDLVNADPLFDVTAQSVTYASRRPDGSASSELTGLVVVPDTAAPGFAPKDSIIVLSHSTGVTPSDLDLTDAWYMVANLFAARGYLVIAPDNWGRGGTDAEPETYLMATRTAANSLDLIRAVLADPAYDAARGAAAPRITVVGYSQGGHSAVALWQAITAQEPTVSVPAVYAGAGPYNLYATARGVVQHADGSCNDDAYCRYVTDETTVPFLSERVMPGFLAYAASDLTLTDLTDGSVLTPGFVDGFLLNDPAYDAFKGLLQQGSFSNITGGLEALSSAGTRFTLFHSEYDRLVPIANTEELVPVLEPHFTVDFRTDACDSDAYEAVFNATDQVGISHALCGFEMLNDVYAELQ